MSTTLYATIVLMCDLGVIRITVDPSVDLTGMHCVGWCTNSDMSVVEDYDGDITSSWDATNVDSASTHIVLLAAVPDWHDDFYPAHSIVWYDGNYYYAPADTIDEPGQGGTAPWDVLDIENPDFVGQWSYVIADPATYGAMVLSHATKDCNVIYCTEKQTPRIRLYTGIQNVNRNVYFIYSNDGSVYVTSSKYPNNIAYSYYINVDNCQDYTIYDFNTPGWSELTPNVVGDIVDVDTGSGGYSGIHYYYCISDTILSPADDPSSWTEIILSSEDFETYWSTALAGTYDGAVGTYIRHVVIDCDSWQIMVDDIPPVVSCDEMETTFGGGYTVDFNGNETADLTYYTFISYKDKVELPSTYNMSNGAYSFDMKCGVEYAVNTFIVPKYTNQKQVYLTGSIIVYNNRIYSALYTTSNSPDADPSAWTLVSPEYEKYDETMYAYFKPVLDECYIGPTGSVTSIVSCPCEVRYDINMTYQQSCSENYVAIIPSATISGSPAVDCNYAIFVFHDGALVTSYASNVPVGADLADGTYDVYVACASNWDYNETPYAEGSIVWHDGNFWVALFETSQEPLVPSMKGPMQEWEIIGITSGDFTTYWEQCGTSPAPTYIEYFEMILSCSGAKHMMNMSSSYYYTCGGGMLNGSFVVSQDGNPSPCYAVVVMLYGIVGPVTLYYLPGTPTSASMPIPLKDGDYQIETYVIPCWTVSSVCDTGEIVTHSGKLWVSNVDGNSDEPGIGAGWFVIESPVMREFVITIKDPEYPGEANYELDYMSVSCDPSKEVQYETSLDLNCEDLSMGVRFSANISAVRFAFVSWLFDVTNFGIPLSQLEVSNFTDPVLAPPVVNCHGGDDSTFIYSGLENNSAYAVLSMAVPHYVFGYAYNPGDLVFYNGEFWQADPAGSPPPIIMSVPATPDWIKVYSPGNDCSSSYWDNFSSYMIGEDYSKMVAAGEFDCTSKDDASEYDMSHSEVNSADASFALIRTNPALAGNISLTVDTAGDLWFNSIDSSEDLAKDQYKHYPVDITRSHPANLYSFFDKGRTPSDIVFKVKSEVNPSVMPSRYEDQFDFSLYYSGVKYMKSKYYDEKFTYFAPMYIKKVLPEYFVIFKVNDPLNMPIDQLKSYDYDQTDYMYELLKRATLIKSFDLSTKTKAGKYLRSIVSDPMFPKSPLNVNFAQDGMTTWNGASVASGTWNSKGELLYDIYCDDDPLKYFERYITDGYSRHGVIFPNIINLEFLFDDETSSDFDFNRYIGFYVNATAFEKFDLDVARYNAGQAALGNSPIFFDLVDDCSDQSRNVTNASGVVIPYAHRDDSIDYRDFGLFREKLYVNYVKDKDNMLYGLVADNPYAITVNGSESALDTMRLADTTVDISRFFGTDRVFIQDKGRAAGTDGLATSYIRIKGKLSNYDVIRVYHDAGDNSDQDGRYDDIIVYSQQSAPEYLPNPGDYYFHTLHSGSPVSPNSYYVNGDTVHGRVDPLVGAISGCIAEFPNKTFEAVVINDCIFLRSYASSLANGEYGIKFVSQVANAYDNIEIGGFTGQDLVGRLVRFSGGTDRPNRLVISGRHKQKIIDNMPELRVRTVNGWSRILSVSSYSDALDSQDRQSAYDDYFGSIVLVLEKNELPDVSDGGFLIKTAAHAEFGVLSFFNVKDFDCDFYSTKYNRHPYWEYYKHLVLPSGSDILIPGVTYIVRTDDVPGTIIYNGTTISLPHTGSPWPSNPYEASFVAVSGAASYSIPSDGGSPVVSYGYPNGYPGVDSSLCQGVHSPIQYGSMYFDKNKDMNSFDGFFAIRDSRNRTADLVGSVDDLTEYYGRFTDDIIRSEYDYYRENFTKDFAFTSKIQPSICKWGYSEGLDARDNEYRLNNHIFFGEHNFSPSHVLDTQDESKMTHEWYYLVAKYPFIQDRKTLAANYCYFEDNLDLDALLNVKGEFERYFTYVPVQDVDNQWIEIGRIQPRYSVIRYNEVMGTCETFFRGAKMLFRDVLRDSNGNIIYNSVSGKPECGDNRRFDGYKFSVLLRPVKEDLDDPDQPPLRMRFIEHEEFKFVLFLIEFAVGHSGSVNPYLTTPLSLESDYSTGAYGVDWLYSNHPSSRIDGDYRISFDDEVSDITYSFLYGVKNKKFGWRSDLFSTIRLATRFSSPALTIDRAYVESNYAYSNYDANMVTDITEYGGDSLTSPYVIAALYYGEPVFTGYPLTLTQNYVGTSGGALFSYSVSGGGFTPDLNMLSAYRQVAGGRKHYEKFMKKLSFAAISRYINEMGPYKDKRNGMVEYETYASAGSAAVMRDFYAEAIPPSLIPKTKAIVPEIDSVVPDQFVQEREIGYEYKKGTLQRAYNIYRYGGRYEPIFRNVFTFISKYAFDYNPQLRSVFLANNVFATEMENFGVLENFCHMKVSDGKILMLQDDPKFYPAYELLDEITIGRDSFLALHSSWDYGFHKKYTAKDKFVPVAGSLRVKEDYTYFSKVLNLPPNSYLLDYAKANPPMQYDSKITYEPVRVDDISAVNMEDYCFVYSTGREEGEYVGYINLRNAMIHKFKTNGASRKFDEFLTPSALDTAREYIGYTSVDDYVTSYLTENVYDLYDVMDVYFYKRDYDDDSERFDVEYHDDSVLLNMDWSVTKDVKINKYSRHVLSFTFKKPLNSGVTISPAIKIRLI